MSEISVTRGPGVCRICGELRPEGYSVTCGRSECQEADYRQTVAARTPKRKRKARQSVTRDVELQPVIQFLRDLVAGHPVQLAGECRICGHYGQDCHGSRAMALLEDLTGDDE